MANIRLYLNIKAPPSKVYQALTDTEKISEWWAVNSRGASKPGSVISIGFKKDDSFTFRMRVEELKQDSYIKWYCLGNPEEWKDTILTFELEAAGKSTELNFAQLHWESEEGAYGMCTFDWAIYLNSLRNYLETDAPQTGKGTLRLANRHD